MSTIALIYFFLQNYLVPFLFVIGIIYFIQGIIYYFILDGEQQHGRVNFLKSISWFVVALLVYSVVALFGWLGSRASSLSAPTTSGDADSGVEINRTQGILGVPNAPRENDRE